jgi:protein-L-isoaspartate(D-aspartate) O-methyltransferase
MVLEQIAARGIRDPRVLGALRRVPRHRFVPVAGPDTAHGDFPVDIGEGQTISQPYMVAEMTALALTATSPIRRVLDVGTGSGYQAAILAAIVPEVVSIERIRSLSDRARATLSDLGIANVEVRVGDGSVGVPERAPYCAIVVAAAAPEAPAALMDQLRPGGVLVVPVGPRGFQDLLAIRRTPAGFVRENSGGCVFVPLIGAQGWPERGADRD